MFVGISASAGPPVVVHRDRGCPRCERWAEDIRAQFKRPVSIIDECSRMASQQARGAPQQLISYLI